MKQDLDDASLVFEDLPPFPTDVPIAPLLCLSLAKLLSGDEAELDNLWRACCDLGFFYLDLRNAPVFYNSEDNLRRDSVQQSNTSKPLTEHAKPVDGNALLSLAASLFPLGSDIFAAPDIGEYDFADQGSYFGYKGFGSGVIDSKGTRDGNEFYNISKDDILGIGERLPGPAILDKPANRAELAQFMRSCHAIQIFILEVLNQRLGLPDGTLQGLHRLEGVSGDQVRFVRSPPVTEATSEDKLKLGEHTDFGSVTVLFNRLGGLQVKPPSGVGDYDGWCYVKPLKGHCVVNLGDAMVKFTSGILRSNMHRVASPPGEQAKAERMSLVYFGRPEDVVMLKALEGSDMIDQKRATKVEFKGEEVISAKEWILRRALARRTNGNWKESLGTEGDR